MPRNNGKNDEAFDDKVKRSMLLVRVDPSFGINSAKYSCVTTCGGLTVTINYRKLYTILHTTFIDFKQNGSISLAKLKETLR